MASRQTIPDVHVGARLAGFVGFLHAEVGWTVPFVVIGVVLAVVAFVAVVLSPNH
jgi:hypothetical protein